MNLESRLILFLFVFLFKIGSDASVRTKDSWLTARRDTTSPHRNLTAERSPAEPIVKSAGHPGCMTPRATGDDDLRSQLIIVNLTMLLSR